MPTDGAAVPLTPSLARYTLSRKVFVVDKEFLKYLGVLSGLTLAVWSFVSGLLQGILGYVNPATFGPAQALAPLPALFITCLLNAGVVLWVTHRTSLTGKELGVLVFVVVFGVMFFLPQLDTVYFKETLGIAWGVIGATLASGIGVGWVSAKTVIKYQEERGMAEERSQMKVAIVPPMTKLLLLAMVYVVLYYLLGYFIVWQSSAARLFYSGTQEIAPFWVHMRRQESGLFILQIVRGLLWGWIGYVVSAHILQASLRERMILVGLALSVGLAFPILVPNPYMPWSVRQVHFVELLTENFLFGVLAAWLFKPEMVAN